MRRIKYGHTKPGRVPKIECNRWVLGHQCRFFSCLVCGAKPCVGYYETRNARFRV